MDEVTTWVLGILLILIGSLGNNLGNNLVSLAHSQEKQLNKTEKIIEEGKSKKQQQQQQTEDKHEDTDKEIDYTIATEGSSFHKSTKTTVLCNETKIVENKPWYKKISLRTLGTLIFVFGNLFTFAAFGFGAQSLLAALESVQFVSNVFFAKFVHKEKITVSMVLATISICAGDVLVVVFSNQDVVLLDSYQMIALYEYNTSYHAYLAIVGFLWIVNHFTYYHYYKVRMVQRRLLWAHSFIEPFTYAVSSAIIGTQAVLLSKCMSMLIQVSAYGNDQFTYFFVYLVLFCWIVLVAFWLRRLDLGLSLYPPLFIIPVLQVFFILFAIMCGGVYFEEFDTFKESQFIGFAIGVVMILAGVFGLAPKDTKLQIPTDGDEPIECDLEAKGGLTAVNECDLHPHNLHDDLNALPSSRRGN